MKISPKSFKEVLNLTNENLPLGSGRLGYWLGESLPSPLSNSLASLIGNISIEINASPIGLY